MGQPMESLGQGKTNYFRESLVAELSSLRVRSTALSTLSHHGLSGEAREMLLRDLVRRLLPERYTLVSGVVTDVLGNQTPQLDAVVVDTSVIPPIMVGSTAAVIPIEAAVLCVEIKTTIDHQTLKQVKRQADAIQRIKTQLKGLHLLPFSVFGYRSTIRSEAVEDFMVSCGEVVSVCALDEWAVLRFADGLRTIRPHLDSKNLPGLAYAGMTIAALDEVCKTRRIIAPSNLWKTYLMGPDMWNGRLDAEPYAASDEQNA